MRKVGLFEAKQKLSELVEHAARGERIGITKRGKLAAVMGPAEQGGTSLQQVFAEMGGVRKRSRKPKKVSVKELIEEGRH